MLRTCTIMCICCYFLLWSTPAKGQLDTFVNKISVGISVGATHTVTVRHEQIEEVLADHTITHDLKEPKAGWGNHLGILFTYPLNASFSMRTELQFVHVRTDLEYTTNVSNESIGLIQENSGTLELTKRYIQVPLSIQFTPVKNDRISLYAGVYYNNNGLSGGGSWTYTERNYATNYQGPWVVHDPPLIINSTEKKGFAGRSNIGWLGGGEFSFPLSQTLRGLIGIRYNTGFGLDNIIPPFRRNTWFISMGLHFSSNDKKTP